MNKANEKKVKIYYENIQNEYKIDISIFNLINRAIKETLSNENISLYCEVSLLFCNDDYIRNLNDKYRGINKSTDVLSFPMYSFSSGDLPDYNQRVVLGDIVINLCQADRQAKEIGNSFKREIAFLTVHSVLHLLGYDHVTSKEDEKEMFEKQKKIMGKIKVK